jgi:PAS domain S-box-containing protein
MMVSEHEPLPGTHAARELLDENEQLRMSLDTALEDNLALSEDRDRLLRRVSELARQLQESRSAFARQRTEEQEGEAATEARQSQTEEELRVAFEELQVLTEELEVANTSLHQTNQELDARVEERTRQVREVNAALRATEASFRTISDLVPDLLWRADREGHATWCNQRWFAYTGQDVEEALGHGWLDAVHPDDRVVSRALWDDSIARGEVYQREHRIRGAQGEYRWFLVRAEALRDAGRVLHWFASCTDIHAQRVAMDALQQSELRFRTLVEGMPQLAWRAVDAGQWTWCSPQWSAYTGQQEEQACGLGWLDAFHPDDRERARNAWARAARTGSLEFEGRIFHAKERRHRHFRTRALPVRAGDGAISEWLGTSTDVDDILQLQEHQSVLVAELQHRTRNLMAVVQAVTRRTLKGVDTLEAFSKCIDDRLQALARVQGLLSRREGGMRVPFDLLLREELSAHTSLDPTGRGGQISLAGPQGVPLRSAMVQTLALALHELATNAVKYGALSEPEGHLHVEWGIESEPSGEPRLWIDWRESGVADIPDPNAPPRGGGYGRELIERALPYQLGARTTYQFEPDGVHCTIEIAIPGEDMASETRDG